MFVFEVLIEAVINLFYKILWRSVIGGVGAVIRYLIFRKKPFKVYFENVEYNVWAVVLFTAIVWGSIYLIWYK